MNVQLLTPLTEVRLLIRPLLFNRVSSWSETLPKDHFWKSRPKFIFFVKFDTTMPKIVRMSQLMIRKPLGVENIVIFAIRAAVSEIQLILTLNGKLALLGY